MSQEIDFGMPPVSTPPSTSGVARGGGLKGLYPPPMGRVYMYNIS
jgi:hypothetical protein